MSATQPIVPVDPANLPPDTLISYAQFEHLLPGTHRAQIEENARKGRFPAGTRPTKRKPMIWRAADVARYLSDRLAVLGNAEGAN